MNSCQRLSLSACCRRPAPALPLYEVASPVLLVTMHSQPGRDLALGLRSLPAREGLRRFGRPPKERGGVPAWSSVTSAHLSSLPSPVSDPSRLSRRLRSAADTVSCQLCRADVSQVGAMSSPFGFEALTVYAFVLEPYPAMPCFNGGSFLSVPVGWVLCYMFSVLSLQVVSSLSGPKPLILASTWGFSWAFNACALTPSFACLRPAFVVPT